MAPAAAPPVLERALLCCGRRRRRRACCSRRCCRFMARLRHMRRSCLRMWLRDAGEGLHLLLLLPLLQLLLPALLHLLHRHLMLLQGGLRAHAGHAGE